MWYRASLLIRISSGPGLRFNWIREKRHTGRVSCIAGSTHHQEWLWYNERPVLNCSVIEDTLLVFLAV